MWVKLSRFELPFTQRQCPGQFGIMLRALLIEAALDNWHNDGDFFVHFLDSPEQALLVIPLWSDIAHKGGGTAVNGDGIKYIAKHLVIPSVSWQQRTF